MAGTLPLFSAPARAGSAADWSATASFEFAFTASVPDGQSGVDDFSTSWLVGDWDGDGDEDLMRRTATGSANLILIWTKMNSFEAIAPTVDGALDEYWGATGDGTFSWHVADLNGDGKSDLVRRHIDPYKSKTFLSSYANNGSTGTFTVTHGADDLRGQDGSRWTWLVGDFDGDGNQDLARRDRDGMYNKVVFSNGDGTLAPVGSKLGASLQPDDLEGANAGAEFQWFVGDFDGDGRSDMMRRSQDGRGNALLLSRFTNGAGYFEPFIGLDGYKWTAPSAYWFVGDVDGDGLDDLVRRKNDGSGAPNYNRIAFSQGDGSFDFVIPVTADGQPEALKTGNWTWISGDFDGDGRMDLVRRSDSGSWNHAIFSRYTSDGSGFVDVEHNVDTVGGSAGTQYKWLLADINNDGRDDLIRRSSTGSENRALLATTSKQAPLFVPGDTSTSEITYSRFRIPALVTAPDGTLLAFAEGRVEPGEAIDPNCSGNSTHRDSGNIDVVLRRSKDGGETWNVLETVLDADCETVGNPTPVVDVVNEKVFLLVSENAGDIDGFPVGRGERRVWVARLSSSTGSWDDAQGTVWSVPQHMSGWAADAELGEQGYQDRDASSCVVSNVDEFCVPPDAAGWTGGVSPFNFFNYDGSIHAWDFDAVGPGNGIQSSSGALVVPAIGRNIVSHDYGDSWDFELLDADCTNEGTIVELTDGSLLRNDRPRGSCSVSPNCADPNPDNRNPNYRAVGVKESGTTSWGPFAPDSDLLDPVSQGSMIRVDDADTTRLMFVNSESTCNRRNLVVRVSYDDHDTWKYSRPLMIDPAGGEPIALGGYSSITVVRRGVLAVLAEALDTSGEAGGADNGIVFRRFNLNWVTGGDPDS